MNILLVSHYAGSPNYGMEYRSYYMAREWVKQGQNVLIVGASYSHLRKKQPKVSQETIDGIQYIWLKTNTYNGNGIKRILSIFVFTFKLFLKTKKLVKFLPDVVIASSVYTFDIYPSNRIAKKSNAKLVYEVHDLWPLSPMEIGGYSKNHPFIWLLQKGEDYAYKHSDKVVSFLDKSFPHMKGRGLKEEKFYCIPNGYLKEEWQFIENDIPDEHKLLFEKLKQSKQLIIGFAGGHTQSTAMTVLIKAARLLRNNSNLSFVLVGDGAQKQELMELAKQNDLVNVYFLPSVEKKYIPKIVSNFDIAYMGGISSKLHKYGTSFNKMTDYMLSSKPIIASVDEPNSVIERINCGIQVEAENPKLVSDAIIKLASLSDLDRIEMGNRGKKYAEDNLEYSILAKRFIKYCD